MGRTLHVMEADEHRVNRLLVSRPFLPNHVRGCVEGCTIEEATRRFDAVEDESEIEIVQAFG